MSQLSFQGPDLVAKFGSNTELQVVFRYIEKELAAVQEVVCQFKINGMALTEETEKTLAQAKVGEVQVLEVTGQRPRAILGDILVGWVQQIPNLIKKNDTLAGAFRFKGAEGQLRALVDLIDDAQLLIDSISSIQTVFAQMPLVKSAQWRDAQIKMGAAVGEVLAAFQKKDYTLLADILEYDMGHALQVWLDTLAKLQAGLTEGHVESDSKSANQTQPK